MAAIKIISVPPGEAPQHIREAWVGLVLPLTVPFARRGLISVGVLTGPKTYWGRLLHLMQGKLRRRLLGREQGKVGFLVNVEKAITLLELANPTAAHWWRENTPHMFTAGHNFIFSAEVCEPVEEIIWPPPPNPQSR